ncbi:MAG: hypothetical protein ACYC6Y_26640 [Thermoguttaceae bacterium]
MRAVSVSIVAFFCVGVVMGQTIATEPGTGQVIERTEFLVAEPDPTVALAPQAPTDLPPAAPAASQGGCAEGSCGCQGACASGRCGSCCPGCGSCRIGSTCNMGQHHAYYPPLHGYYYFIPYHPSHVRQQQQLVLSWGGNPSHPYANELFEQVYRQYKAEVGQNTAPAAK